MAIWRFLLTLAVALPLFTAAPESVYLVELKGEPAAAGLVRLRGAERRRAAPGLRQRVRAGQQAALNRMALRGAVLGATDTVANVIITRISAEEAARLARRPEVARVEKSVPLYPAVDRAVDVQQVRSVWEMVGGIGQAGAGIKIGIIDTGVDVTHPAFEDPDLKPPEGFPKSDSEEGSKFTNGKIIVQRNYEKMVWEGATPTYLDERGHGTAVASIAAGARHNAGAGTFAGVAPKAWIGVYKVFRSTGSTSDAVYLKALDDAVTDGMDVVNLSIGGGDWDSRAGIVSDGERRAVEMGTQVAYSAGNQGPGRATVNLRPDGAVLLVGAASNSRFFGGAVRLADGAVYPAIPAAPPDTPTEAVTAPLKAVADVDPSGVACDPLPPGSFQGKIGVAFRGDWPGVCATAAKQVQLKNAGAVGMLVVSDPKAPLVRGVAAGVLPSLRVSYDHGREILDRLKAGESVEATLEFAWEEKEAPPGLADFSSRGPGWQLAIQPDLTAVGQYVWHASPRGQYAVGDGTSFSAPMVAGAMAILKGARPGLAHWQYRSLIVNTTREMWTPVMGAGSGMLDLETALRASVVVNPVSISFGARSGEFDLERELVVQNLGEAASLAIAVEPLGEGPAPTVEPAQLELATGQEQKVKVRLAAKGVPVGEYQGFLVIQGPETRTRIAYWFAVSTGRTESISMGSSTTSGKPGDLIEEALLFRTTDRFGIPTARGVSWRRLTGDTMGFGPYILGQRERGMWQFDIRLGPKAGRSVFRFTSDDATAEAWYTATGDDAERYLAPNTLSPAAGDVPVGQTRDLTIRFTNLGRKDVTIREIRFPNAQYMLRSPTLPATIAPGATADVVIRFAPAAPGVSGGYMRVISDDAQLPNLYIWLTGRGT